LHDIWILGVIMPFFIFAALVVWIWYMLAVSIPREDEAEKNRAAYAEKMTAYWTHVVQQQELEKQKNAPSNPSHLRY
jgi:uncharacterized membrane protein